jgi:hypothetical protein
VTATPVDPLPVDVALPPGWFPFGPVPGALLAAAAVAADGCAVATMTVALHHVEGLATADDASAAFAAVPADTACARELRWCAPHVVAVLTAHPTPGAPVGLADLRAALRQTAVYAVDSSGSASSDSSVGVANDGCRGSTRTV